MEAKENHARATVYLDKLAEELPSQVRTCEDGYTTFSMQMPEDPLTILTVVIEQDDGRLVPLLTNGG